MADGFDISSLAGCKSRSFELEAEAYLARQDRIFEAAIEGVLGIGCGFLDQFEHFVAFETKATQQIDGCLLLKGGATRHLIVLQANRTKRWLFQIRYKVTLHWGIPDEAMLLVLQLCDPDTHVPPVCPVPKSGLIAQRLSERLKKPVAGLCDPDCFVQMKLSPDGRIILATFQRA